MINKSRQKVYLAMFLIVFVLVVGSIFYHIIESWSWIDSFYFTVVTLTTIGYGDLAPTHDISKILTSVFALASIPIILFAFSIIAENYFDKRLHRLVNRQKKAEDEEEK